MIITLCILLENKEDFGMAIHQCILCMYFVYVVWINEQVMKIYDKIIRKLADRYNQISLKNMGSIFVVIQASPFQSRRIWLEEMILFKKHFIIHVHDLLKINLPLMFQALLFVIGYVVIFRQTN